MRKLIITFISGIILGAVVSGLIVYNKTKVPTPQPIHDTIQVKMDSIQIQIDTVFKDRTKLKYIYEKNAETILNQSSDSDWEYYINFLRSRFPDNTDSIEAY